MQIKETPEDFIVEEKIRLNTKFKGDYTYFLLEKRINLIINTEAQFQCQTVYGKKEGYRK